MRYDLAIFDFDGTLADSREWFFGSLNQAAARFGFLSTSAEEQENLRRLGASEIMRRLRVPMYKVPAITRYMRRRAADEIATISLFDGVADAVRALRDEGLVLAMVSSNDERNVRTVLGPALSDAFAHYGCGSSLFGKSAKLKRAMTLLGSDPARTVSIGDETRDIDAARAVGCVAASVAWGYAAPETLRACAPDLFLETPSDLITRLT